MSLAFRCNRCKTFFDVPNAANSITRLPRSTSSMELRALPLSLPSGAEVTSIPLHLCPACAEAFQRFIAGEGALPRDPTFEG